MPNWWERSDAVQRVRRWSWGVRAVCISAQVGVSWQDGPMCLSTVLLQAITTVTPSCSAVPWPLRGGLCSPLFNDQRGRRFM